MSEKWVDQLVEEVYPSLLLYGISLTGKKNEAEDLVQEAVCRFLLIYDKLDSRNYKAWLMRVMRNFFFDTYRKKKKSVTLQDGYLEGQADENDPLTLLLATREQEALFRALISLKPNFQEVLFARYFLELSVSEIADLTGLKQSNVKVLLHRGRKRLKERMLKDEEL